MPIKCKESSGEISHYVKERVENLKKAVESTLEYIGERAIEVARTTSLKGKDFTDRTGNLRSSMGYVIAFNGAVMHRAGFSTVNKGAQGAHEGAQYCEQVAKTFSHGYALVVAAGMHYATYVSARGYDVLDSAETIAVNLANQLLRFLK